MFFKNFSLSFLQLKFQNLALLLFSQILLQNSLSSFLLLNFISLELWLSSPNPVACQGFSPKKYFFP